MSPRPESRVLAQLREIDATLKRADIRYALIGGFAVNIHGFVRATRDVDVMIDVEDGDALHDALMGLGYRPIDRREDIASYVRKPDRLDVIYARRPISRDLLSRSRPTVYGDTELAVIPVEGLIGLKVQALADDPRRIDDLTDIIEIMKIHREDLDRDEVRRYFRLFDHEKWLDDILRALD